MSHPPHAVQVPLDKSAFTEMLAALKEAERFMAYFSGESGGTFVGPGMPAECLAQIRAARARAEGRMPPQPQRRRTHDNP